MDLASQMKSIGCPPELVTNLNESLDTGLNSPMFTSTIAWLSSELASVTNLESTVHAISSHADSYVFMIELSSMLRELNCPYACLTEGELIERLIPLENRNLLLTYLISELQAGRIISTQNKGKDQSNRMTVQVLESTTAKELKNMLIVLNFSKPPPTITPMQLFSKVGKKLSEIISQMYAKGVPEPLFIGTLTSKQWFQLSELRDQLQEDYAIRRTMMLTRLNVTVQSFNWSERLKNAEEAIQKVYMPFRATLQVEPSVRVSDILASRKDLLAVEAASSASVRAFTRSSVNKVVIGDVPDRGGRPEEQQPPPPEVPSWQKNEPNKSGSGFQRSNFSNDRSFSSGDTGRDQFGGQGGMQNYRSQPQTRGGGRGGRDNYSSGGRDNYSSGGRDNYSSGGRDNYSSGGRDNYSAGGRGGSHMKPVSAYENSGNYQMMDPYQHGVVPGAPYTPPSNMYPQYIAPTPMDMGYGVGIGGYSATGGNFQQYGVTQNMAYNQNNQAPNARGSYHSRRGGGGNPRGYRRGR